MSKTHVSIEGETVDAIAFAYFGRHQGTTEAIYDANPGLADHGLLLPAGLSIAIPEMPAEAPSARTVKLYD